MSGARGARPTGAPSSTRSQGTRSSTPRSPATSPGCGITSTQARARARWLARWLCAWAKGNAAVPEEHGKGGAPQQVRQRVEVPRVELVVERTRERDADQVGREHDRGDPCSVTECAATRGVGVSGWRARGPAAQRHPPYGLPADWWLRPPAAGARAAGAADRRGTCTRTALGPRRESGQRRRHQRSDCPDTAYRAQRVKKKNARPSTCAASRPAASRRSRKTCSGRNLRLTVHT